MVITLRHSRFEHDQLYKSFRDKREFLDLKLCSDSSKEKFISGHRIILGAVSSVWKKQLLRSTNTEKPVVVKNIKHDILVQIVDYIYNGKIVISEKDFEDFSDAYRMINLRLGSQSDKKMYEDNSEGENDLVKIGDDDSRTKKRPHSLPPLQLDDQGLVSSTTNLGPKVKRMKMSPEQLDTVASNRGVVLDKASTNNGIAPHNFKAVDTNKPLDKATTNNGSAPHTFKAIDTNNKLEVEPSTLKKGPGGHYWIRIERKNINVEAVADTCRRFGQILRLVHLPQIPHLVHVAFQTEEAVNNSIKILRICGYPNCYNTTVLPSQFNFAERNSPPVSPPLPPTASPTPSLTVPPPLPPTTSPSLTIPPPLPPTASPKPSLTAPPPLPPTSSPKPSLTVSPPLPPTASPTLSLTVPPPLPPTASPSLTVPPPLPPTASRTPSLSVPPPLPPTASPTPFLSAPPPLPPTASPTPSLTVPPPLPPTTSPLPLPQTPPPILCVPSPPLREGAENSHPISQISSKSKFVPQTLNLENIAARAKQFAKEKGFVRKG